MTADDHLPPLSVSDPAEIEPRAGDLLRVRRTRTVVAVCRDCTARFGNTGAAASHSRSSRHRVDVEYSPTFSFAPIELLDRVR